MDTRHTVSSGSTTDTPFSHAHEDMITIPLIEYNLLLQDRAAFLDRDAVAKERKDTVRRFHAEIKKLAIMLREQNATITQLEYKNESLQREIESLQTDNKKLASLSQENTGLKAETPSAEDYAQMRIQNAKLETMVQSLRDSIHRSEEETRKGSAAHVKQLTEMKKMYEDAKSEYQEEVERLHKDAEVERRRVLQLTQVRPDFCTNHLLTGCPTHHEFLISRISISILFLAG